MGDGGLLLLIVVVAVIVVSVAVPSFIKVVEAPLNKLSLYKGRRE